MRNFPQINYETGEPLPQRKPHIWKQGGFWRCGWQRFGAHMVGYTAVAAYGAFEDRISRAYQTR